MSRQLIALNAALVLVSALAVAYVVRELRAPAPPPARRAAPPPPPAVAPASSAEPAPAGGYNIVASRNLFSPNRSEAPPTPIASAAAAPPQPKPNLYGILLSEGAPVAYLEDPTTKRVAGYRPGDAIAGGTVKQIGADHVVLNRPEGEVSVRLRDPAKPRPPAPLADQQPGAPGRTTAPLQPGMQPPPPGVAGAPVTPPAPGAVTQNPPGGATILPRRPLPPNLLRRLPPPASDAQPQN